METISISREVLEQVKKDGRTYVSLAKQMATIILEGMQGDPFSGGEVIEVIHYGMESDTQSEYECKVAKRWREKYDLPVVAEMEGRVIPDPDSGNIRVSQYKVYPKG